MDSGIVDIRGKSYKTIARRVADFRSMPEYAGYRIETQILEAGELVLVKATVRDCKGTAISMAHAEELRGSTNINKTSAIENCETSAVGRALAFLDGELAGTEIASADEVANALTQQAELEQVERLVQHNRCVREHWDSICAIKDALAADEYETAYEAFNEIPEDDKRALWIAPTKGGVFTTRERDQMKSNEWTEARRSFHAD